MLPDISLHLLDLAVNSVKAGAITVALKLFLAGKVLHITVKDDGAGMSPTTRETLAHGICPGEESHTGRGVMLFRDASRKTGGVFCLESEEGKGTCLSASFCVDSPFCPVLGDVGETVALLVTGNRGLRIKVFLTYEAPDGERCSYGFDSDLLRGGVRLNATGKYYWIREEINKGVMNIFGGVLS